MNQEFFLPRTVAFCMMRYNCNFTDSVFVFYSRQLFQIIIIVKISAEMKCVNMNLHFLMSIQIIYTLHTTVDHVQLRYICQIIMQMTEFYIENKFQGFTTNYSLFFDCLESYLTGFIQTFQLICNRIRIDYGSVNMYTSNGFGFGEFHIQNNKNDIHFRYLFIFLQSFTFFNCI